jgi:predicted DNA-binding protein
LSRDMVICFRTSEKLRKALEKISRDERRTLSSCIKSILYAYIEERESKSVDRERRRCPRKKVSAPVLVRGLDGAVHAGMLHDISLDGIRISVPPGFQCEVGEESAISVVFTLPEGERALIVVCLPRHIHSNGETTIGASFIYTDLQSYQTLQGHTMGVIAG